MTVGHCFPALWLSTYNAGGGVARIIIGWDPRLLNRPRILLSS